MIRVATYDGFTRDGTSKDVRALHIGGERWFVEFYASGLYVRFGAVGFTAGFDWPEDR